MKSIFRWMVTALLWVALGAAQAQGNSVFQAFDGKQDSVEAHTGNGKWLVVMMWAHDCHVCNMEVEQYAHFHEAHADGDASVLGISIDGLAAKARAEDFIRRHDVPFPNLIGASTGAVMHWYRQQTGANFLGTPTILVYAPDGSLKAAQAGAVPTETIEKFIADNS